MTTARPGGTGVRGRFAQLVPGGPAGRRLGVMVTIDSVGTGAYLAVSAIFCTRSVGLSVAQVGLGLSLAAAIGLASTVPVGGLADRYGARRVLVITSLWRAVGFLAYPFIHDFPAFLVVVCLLGLVDKTAAPLEQALVSQAVDETDRVRTMAVLRALRNAGFTVGALIGSVALALDSRPAYGAALVVNAASFVALATIAARLPLREDRVATRRLSLRVLGDRPYLTLAALNALLSIHMTFLSVGIPVWVVFHSHAPRAVVAPLLAVNTVLAVAFQVPASRGSDTPHGAASRLRQAGVALGGCCVLLAVVPSLGTLPAIAVLVMAMASLTAGEVLQSAGGWGLSYAHARPEQQGAYLSLFWLGNAVQQIAAPVLVAAVVSLGSLAWVLLAAVLVAGGLAVPAANRWMTAVRGSAPYAERLGL